MVTPRLQPLIPSPFASEWQRARFSHRDLPELAIEELHADRDQLERAREKPNQSRAAQAWIDERLERIKAELTRRNGHGTSTPPTNAKPAGDPPPTPRRAEKGGEPNLPPIGTSVVGEVRPREISAADLRRRGLDTPSRLDYLPMLAQTGFVVKGWCHLLAGYPKSGKTELLVRLCHEWAMEKILYFTEEPESIWTARLAGLNDGWEHLTVCFALGMEPTDLLKRIQEGRETVAIIDTARNLLGLKDETDNSEVARVLNPYIAACRDTGKTLIFAHHVRKGGGEYGEGITGGHAFLGVVDIALELLRDGQGAQRKIRGWGRIANPPELLYTMRDDGTFEALGSPQAVALENVKERILENINGEWQTRKELAEALEAPKPSQEQIRQALDALVGAGLVERDPAQAQPGRTYKYRRGGAAT